MAAEPKPKSLDNVINQVLTSYPSIKIAKLEIERARQEFAKIESQLGWILSAQTGVSHDVGAFNIPSDRFSAAASIGSVQESGNSLEISGQYSYEDSDTVVNITNWYLNNQSIVLLYTPFESTYDNSICKFSAFCICKVLLSFKTMLKVKDSPSA